MSLGAYIWLGPYFLWCLETLIDWRERHCMSQKMKLSWVIKEYSGPMTGVFQKDSPHSLTWVSFSRFFLIADSCYFAQTSEFSFWEQPPMHLETACIFECMCTRHPLHISKTTYFLRFKSRSALPLFWSRQALWDPPTFFYFMVAGRLGFSCCPLCDKRVEKSLRAPGVPLARGAPAKKYWGVQV